MKETLKCTITISSPLHVGCDEFYEPTGFVVDQEKRTLIQFNPIEFISKLEPMEQEKLSQICRKGTVASILELYKFFQGKKADGREVYLCSGFVDHYKKTLQIPEKNQYKINHELNKFNIERTAFRLSDNRPYLPGSSIKGALRTGYLNYVCQGKKINISYDQRKKSKNAIEQQLLDYRQIEEDPFGKVKVSDFQPVGDVKTKIMYAANKKKKLSDKEARGPYQILEIIEPGGVFIGEITVEEAHTQRKIKNPIELDNLISGAGGFYAKENSRENEELTRISISGVNLLKGKINGKIIPLRLGRHSGAESVTLEGNRDIMIKLNGKNKKYLDHATTFWLASPESKPSNSADLFPFGWACVEKLSQEKEKAFDMKEQVYLDRSLKQAEKEHRLAEQIIREQQEADQRLKEKEAELEMLKKEEERRKNVLKAMCMEELFLFYYDEVAITEEQINVAFKKLDDCPEKLKKEVAIRLKKYWQEHHKWTKNQAGKQWKKIRSRNDKIDKIIEDS